MEDCGGTCAVHAADRRYSQEEHYIKISQNEGGKRKGRHSELFWPPQLLPPGARERTFWSRNEIDTGGF